MKNFRKIKIAKLIGQTMAIKKLYTTALKNPLFAKFVTKTIKKIKAKAKR